MVYLRQRDHGKRRKKWHLHLIYFPRGNSVFSAEKEVKRQKKQSGHFCIIQHIFFCDVSFCTSLCLFVLFQEHLFVPHSADSLVFCLICFPTLREWRCLRLSLKLFFWLLTFKIRAYCSDWHLHCQYDKLMIDMINTCMGQTLLLNTQKVKLKVQNTSCCVFNDIYWSLVFTNCLIRKFH